MNFKRFNHIHHADQETIDLMYSDYSPVFILSTGRSGTKFVSEIFKESKDVDSFHEPRPTLQYFSNFAFHNQKQNEVLEGIINSTRMEVILQSYISGKIYLEANQCLTFFANALAYIFKNAKFIHIVRHPGDFTRSAIRKGWYENDTIWESGRVKGQVPLKWTELDKIERLGWLWNTTNKYIERFKASINKNRMLTIKFEDLIGNYKSVQKLIKYINCESINKNLIKELQKTKINSLRIYSDEPENVKKKWVFPNYSEWRIKEVNQLRKYAEELSALYKYKL